MAPALVWTVTAVLLVLGMVGSFLPILPGTPLILAAGLWLEAFLPIYLSTGTLIALGAGAFLAVVLDAVLTAVGGRAFGGGRWGLLGAAIGGLIGLFLGPLGILGGAIMGAVLGEALLAKKALPEAMLAGFGAGAGLVAATAAKTIICAAMVGLFLADCFLF